MSAITWTSDDPHLAGNFAPIGSEVDVAELPVVAGSIPAHLSGVYMRNGPNPFFKPLSYTYPLDGDGMIHAVYIDNGNARYRNRFVDTRGLRAERRAGRAIYGGVMRPVPVDPALIAPDGDPPPFKNGAFINVLRHGGHLLALSEAASAYEMTMDLDTIGEWRAGTGQPLELGAHNRRHPATGAMFALCYGLDEAVVRIHQVDASGKLVRTFPVQLAAPTMMHDFVLTEQHVVLLACPVVFDMAGPEAGKPVIQWHPELGTRIGVVALDGSAVQWFDTEPFFVFHFANGFERGNSIVIDYVRHDSLRLGSGSYDGGDRPPALHRMTIDRLSSQVADARIADMLVEFPRSNDRLETTPTRFVYVPTRTAVLDAKSAPAASFNVVTRVDAETGDVVRHDFGNRLVGEAVFVPGEGSEEDDGYLAVFVFDPDNQTSDFVLLDAAHVDQPPVAVIRLPQRVPQGLHGNWIATG